MNPDANAKSNKNLDLEPLKGKITIIPFMYLTKKEQEYEWHDALLQIILGLQCCKTKEDVIELLQDVRALEQKRTLIKIKSAVEWQKMEDMALIDRFKIGEIEFVDFEYLLMKNRDNAFEDVVK